MVESVDNLTDSQTESVKIILFSQNLADMFPVGRFFFDNLSNILIVIITVSIVAGNF